MLPIQASDFSADGVFLTTSADPDFDALAQTVLSSAAAPILDLKPFLAVVTNRNPRTVVAYTVQWLMRRGNESTEMTSTQFKFPDAVAAAGTGLGLLQGREIRSGEHRLVGMGFEVWPPTYIDSYRQFGQQAAAQLGDIVHLGIVLDAVIFDDGTLLGRDQSHLAEHFILFVQAKQEAYRDVLVALENGQSSDQVFAPFRQRIATPPQQSDPVAVYAHEAASETLVLRDRVLLEVFRRALRRDPFSIRRQSRTS